MDEELVGLDEVDNIGGLSLLLLSSPHGNMS